MALREHGPVADWESIWLEGTRIDYGVSRSARRRKTIEITWDHRDGVVVAAPAKTSADQIAATVRRHAAWI